MIGKPLTGRRTWIDSNVIPPEKKVLGTVLGHATSSTGVLILKTPPYVNTDRPKILRFFVNVNTDPGKLARRRREKFELFWPILRGNGPKVVQNRVLLGVLKF